MTDSTLSKATFAAGCFWGVEHKFGRQPGVVSTSVGYTGGSLAEPTYKQVCTDRTGHAEVVELRFDPSVTSYEALLRFFFSMHNPTTRYRSGPDIGSQYRSAIFFHTLEQQATAAAVMAELNQSTFKGGIVTELHAATRFWRAEEYHQRYAEKHPTQACAL